MPDLRRALTATTIVVAITAGAVLGPAQATATPTVLYATVGPGYTITLKNASGVRVRSVRAGRAYAVVVRDRSSIHNFRLTGPGVSRATGLQAVGTVRWNVTFRRGTYTYVCDPHASMRGSLVSS